MNAFKIKLLLQMVVVLSSTLMY